MEVTTTNGTGACTTMLTPSSVRGDKIFDNNDIGKSAALAKMLAAVGPSNLTELDVMGSLLVVVLVLA